MIRMDVNVRYWTRRPTGVRVQEEATIQAVGSPLDAMRKVRAYIQQRGASFKGWKDLHITTTEDDGRVWHWTVRWSDTRYPTMRQISKYISHGYRPTDCAHWRRTADVTREVRARDLNRLHFRH